MIYVITTVNFINMYVVFSKWKNIYGKVYMKKKRNNTVLRYACTVLPATRAVEWKLTIEWLTTPTCPTLPRSFISRIRLECSLLPVCQYIAYTLSFRENVEQSRRKTLRVSEHSERRLNYSALKSFIDNSLYCLFHLKFIMYISYLYRINACARV